MPARKLFRAAMICLASRVPSPKSSSDSMPAPFPVASLRDFYAFEQHVKTCRAHRGLDMVPQWYKVPVFYFSNTVAIIGNDDPVWAPTGSSALDYELELACVVGKAARNLPPDDSALECLAGFTIMNDWSA